MGGSTWEHAAGEEDGRGGLFLLAASCYNRLQQNLTFTASRINVVVFSF